MTITPRRLQSTPLWSQARAIRRTAQASHAFDLADMADDAASGHCSQRVGLVGAGSGTYTYHAWIDPAATGRFWEVALIVAWYGTWSPPDGVTVELSIADGTTTVASTDPAIPRAFAGTAEPAHWPGLAGTGARLASTSRVSGHLDTAALVAAGLNAAVPWRLTFIVTCAATVRAESVEVVELSRFAVDSADAFGATPTTYLPRAIVTDDLSRVAATIEAAYDLARRTYHALSLPQASPDIVTSTTWAAVPGAQTLTGSTAIPWKVRPRRIKGAPRVRFGVRYLTTTAGGADVRVTTAAGTYTLALAGTSGTWADALSGAGTLADATSDTIAWEAQVSAGQLKIAAYWVTDDPQP